MNRKLSRLAVIGPLLVGICHYLFLDQVWGSETEAIAAHGVFGDSADPSGGCGADFFKKNPPLRLP
jgi:hypothetical protein